MTLPTPPAAAPEQTSLLTEDEGPVFFPLGWVLSNSAAPIQYRAIKEIAKLESSEQLVRLVLCYKPALRLAVAQRADGVWNDAMLTISPSGGSDFAGVGTIAAVRRLLEYGWDRDTPPIHHARRVLFRLLAEDNDPAFVFELAGKRPDQEMVHRGRLILREAAAAALAQAGFESDPRLRGAARRILDRIERYVRSPLAQKPWVRVGNRHVLDPEAQPPSMYALQMLAYMPLFRVENHTQVDHLYAYLAQPLPRQESVQVVGTSVVEQPHLVLGDPVSTRGAADADLPFTLHWLELMARLTFLKRNDSWMRTYERFLQDRDRDLVWRPSRGLPAPKAIAPAVWHTYPLDPTTSGEGRWSDVTFRLGLIAKLLGREIEVV